MTRCILLIYCLLITTTSLYSSNFISNGETVIKKGGFLGSGKVKADFYATENDTYNGIVLIAPGGGINAKNMRGLAKEIAKRNYLAFVIHYTTNYPITPGQANNPIKFAKAIKGNISEIKGLNINQRSVLAATNNIVILAHSLGGAVLGKASGTENSPIDKIIFYGVDSLVSKPSKPSLDVEIYLGEHDNLMNENKISDLASFYNTAINVVPGINHFCIITDKDAGMKQLRNKDGKITLTHEQCVNTLLDAMQL